MPITTSDIVKRFKNIHGEKYDYSKVNYARNDLKVIIICKKHNEFEQSPKDHTSGRGCPACAKEKNKDLLKSISQKNFLKNPIEKFKSVHGEKYDYSKVVYVRNDLKVIIICKKHNEFEQAPRVHLNGSGCPICANEANKGNFKTPNLSFIDRFRSIHGDKYDYSLADYKNSRLKIKISCKEHGVFEQSPNNHLKGRGCPKCAREQCKYNNQSIIEKFKLAHNDKYDYSLVDYVSSNKKVIIICKEHGQFLQDPTSHYRGHGCNKCVENRTIYTYESLVDKFNSVHDNVYDYSKVVFVKVEKKVIITCKLHGDFKQTPSSHMHGNGCPRCRSSKGESRIRKILKDNNIQFEEQYPICKNPETGKYLRADFYIPSIQSCIEFDGIQHFKEIEKWGGKKHLDKTKELDLIKNLFCKNNNINMIRIPYYEYRNINNILKDIFH